MSQRSSRTSIGPAGLDEILHGGLVPRRSYLVRGGPGTGKTTLGLHFLSAGVPNGERGLYITLGEPEAQIRMNARELGFDLDSVPMLDLSPAPEFFTEMKTYEIFSPAEVEREPVARRIIQHIEELRPQRIFVDPLTQLRYLAHDSFEFRRQILSFLHFLVGQEATVLFTSESNDQDPDDYLQILSDGVINLEFHEDARSLNVTKYRGSEFMAGNHSFRLTGKGMTVFPRLIPTDHRRPFNPEPIASGLPQLDEMLGGGIERGTITIITGPSGVGKTTIGIQFMKEAARRGERSVIYSFEEELDIMMRRCEQLNIPAEQMCEQGTLSMVKIEPLRYSPDEFAHMVRTEVEHHQARLIMIDSIAGYRLSLKGEDLVSHLHAVSKYLQNMGVGVLLINELTTLSGHFRVTESSISYLADNVLFMRYLEQHSGSGVSLGKTIGVLKKRLTDFGKEVRVLEFTSDGLRVGPPLVGVSSILTDVPVARMEGAR